ncbi:MAG: HupE/UreJ family protein [Actinomycetota bacterium]
MSTTRESKTARRTNRQRRTTTGRATWLRSLIAAAVVLTTVFATGGAASAHTGDQSYLYLDVTATTVGGRIEVPLADLNEAFDLDLGGTDDEVLATLAANEDFLVDYLDEHFDIGAAGQDWDIDISSGELFFSDLDEIDDNYIVFPFTVDVPVDPVPREFEVLFDPFVDEIDGRINLALIGNDWQNGIIENGDDSIATYDAGSRTQTIDLGDTSQLNNLWSSVKLGVDHIRTGPDHILFVLVLLLPSVLVFTSRWEPAPTWGASLWRVLKIVTMFTIAHSITFSLAGLEILPLPSPRIVESIIALSIAAAAVHNIRPQFANKEWLIAFVFGLFHGMGFASLVSGLDVDRSTQLFSLLGRNIGIEIGQAIVILVLFPALYFLRRTRFYQPFQIVVSIFLAIMALGWVIERSLEVELGVSSIIDPIFGFPVVVVWVGIFTAVSYILMRQEDAAGRLIPVAGSGDEGGSTDADDELVPAG